MYIYIYIYIYRLACAYRSARSLLPTVILLCSTLVAQPIRRISRSVNIVRTKRFKSLDSIEQEAADSKELFSELPQTGCDAPKSSGSRELELNKINHPVE